MITAEQLQAIGKGMTLDRAKQFVPHINAICPKYGIDTPIELASFLAQVLHESGSFKWMKEIWGPTAAQSRYEGRADLGNTVKGDGKKFMGRGPIQITGRANYTRMSKDMFGDNRLLENPDILTTPEYGIQSACIYWVWKKIDAVDDDKDVTAETKKVNGGTNGIEERKEYFERACKVLGLIK